MDDLGVIDLEPKSSITVLENWDYEELFNKPSINDVVLSGNLETADLNLNADEIKFSDGTTYAEKELVIDGKVEEASGYAESALTSETNAKTSEDNAKASEESAETDKDAAQQVYSDFLAQLGTDVAPVVDGKIPLEYIPATAQTDFLEVSSQDELTSLNAQKGDIAQLIEEIDGVDTIVKSWQLLSDDPTDITNWIVWGSSYAVAAAYATTAGNAENASMINNTRVIKMTQQAYETAVTDPTTYYFTYEENDVVTEVTE